MKHSVYGDGDWWQGEAWIFASCQTGWGERLCPTSDMWRFTHGRGSNIQHWDAVSLPPSYYSPFFKLL